MAIAPLQPRRGGGLTLVVEPHPVDHRLVLGEAEQAGPGIAGLGTRGERAHLDEAEAEAEHLAEGLGILVEAGGEPDRAPADVDDLARAALDHRLDGLIVANTTVSRPVLASRHREETGGLSGAPLKALALQRLRDFRRAAGGQLPLIAAGGIDSGADAFARIRAGASLVQLYSALVYRGPGLARVINRELKRLLARDGFASVAEAVGTGA